MQIRKALFTYPTEFKTLPEHRKHSNQVVEVIRALREDEADVSLEHILSGNERMFLIQAEDGWQGEAFHSELSEVF